MARRKQSLFEDLFDILAKAPWWLGVILALTAYIGFHQLATMEVPPPTGTKGVGDFIGMQIYKTFGTYLQYIVPLVCLVAAAASFISQLKRITLHTSVANGTKGALDAMSWREFEQLVGEHFRRRGFAVEESGGGGMDGGVDLVLSRGSDRYFVQCKQWKARQVGVAAVRELYGVMAAKGGAAGGYVVTSGVFTDEARRFAEGLEIELIGGDRLATIIVRQAAPSSPSAKAQASPSERTEPRLPLASEVPACPQCGDAMVLRTARKGENAGKSFWGCTAFPKCRGTRPA